MWGYLLELREGVQVWFEAIYELVYEKQVNVSFKIIGEGPYMKYNLKSWLMN